MAYPIPYLPTPKEWTADLVPAVDATAKALLGSTGTRLVVDLSGTTFLSSAALTCLIRMGKRLFDAGGALALACPTSNVVKLLRLVGLERVLPAFDTLDAAAAYVREARSAGTRR